MDRYFFHIEYGEVSRDPDGTEFPTLSAARSAAVEVLGEILWDERDGFWAKPDLTIIVTDKNGLTLWTLSVVGQEAASLFASRPAG